MRNIVIDTCVIIHIVRQSITGIKCIDILSEMDPPPNIVISVVTKAELESFSKQNNWGSDKLAKLKMFIEAATVIDVKNADKQLIEKYVQMDGFSKGKLSDNNGTLIGGSAKRMGKNDLWIAATAAAINVTLMTTDGDFDHLNQRLIDVLKVA